MITRIEQYWGYTNTTETIVEKMIRITQTITGKGPDSFRVHLLGKTIIGRRQTQAAISAFILCEYETHYKQSQRLISPAPLIIKKS